MLNEGSKANEEKIWVRTVWMRIQKKRIKNSGTTFSVLMNWTRPGPRKTRAVSMRECT